LNVPTKQAAIPSGFGPTTTPRQVLEGIDLTCKVAIVTGGYSGIGLETLSEELTGVKYDS
jgi:hypothetical protein